MRKVLVGALAASVICLLPIQAQASPFTTEQRTMLDCDGDNLLDMAFGERHVIFPGTPDQREEDPCEEQTSGENLRLPPSASIVNFLQLSDFQMVDEESPARVEWLDSTQRVPRLQPFSSAYRPQESLTTQVTEAMVRQARNSVSPITAKPLELSILTGDNADSQQYNETRWFIDILDGTNGNENPDPEMENPELVDADGNVGEPTGPRDRKVDPNSGIPGPDPNSEELPPPACDATPGSVYDGVRNSGQSGVAPDGGYYEPDSSSGSRDDGDGYSPIRSENDEETPGRSVTVRDWPGLFESANEPFEALGLDMPWYSAFGNHDALVQGNSPDAYVGPSGPGHAPAPDATETWNDIYHRIATGCLKVMQPAGGALGRIAQLIKAIEEERKKQPPDQGEIDALTGRILAIAQEVVLNPCDPRTDEDCVGVEIVPPDPRRCFLAKDETYTTAPEAGNPCRTGSWIEQHFRTSGTPVGHGFAPGPALPPDKSVDYCRSEENFTDPDCLASSYGRPPEAQRNNDGYYSFSPKPGLRFAVLDTVTDECGTTFCSEGSVDDPQFDWLEEQIKVAAANGEYVLAFSHHTLRTTRFPTADGTEELAHYGQREDRRGGGLNPQNPSGEKTLEELFCEHPNFVAHVAGHEHENYVEPYWCSNEIAHGRRPTARCAAPLSCPNPHFWHISTAAHIDWPQQARMIELIKLPDPETGLLEMSFVLTMLDHDGPANPGGHPPGHQDQAHAPDDVLRLAGIGREIAFNDYQQDRSADGGRQDRNVILPTDRPPPPYVPPPEPAP